MTQPELKGFRGGEQSVIEGRDGWLFLREFEGDDVLALYTDPDAIPESTYAAWQQALRARREYFAAAGIAYVSLVVPDSCLVYTDKLPEGVELVSPTPLDRLLAGLDEETRAQCVYPLRELVDGRRQRETFQSTDSHWTDFGAYLSYRRTMATLAATRPDIEALPADRLEWSERLSFGAMGAAAVPERSEQLEVAKVRDNGVRRLQEVVTHIRDRYLVEEQDRPDLPTAVVFRDSAMTLAAKYFSQSFRRVVYVSTPNIVLHDLIEQERPDVVIHEFGERRILKHPREPSVYDFAFMFGDLLLDDKKAEGHQRRARSLLEAGHAADALAANDEALALSRPNSRLLVFRGTVHAALGDADAAVEAARHATVLNPSDAFASHMFSRALSEQGQFGPALMACERTLAMDDRHASYWSYGIATAINAGRVPRAVELAESAISRFPDNPEVVFGHACAMTAVGDLEAAEAGLHRALAMAPHNEPFHRQLASVLIRRRKWEEAEQVLVELLGDAPDDPQASAALAQVRRVLALPEATSSQKDDS